MEKKAYLSISLKITLWKTASYDSYNNYEMAGVYVRVRTGKVIL